MTRKQKYKVDDISDIDMSKWKEYDYIWTHSLWIIEKRDNSGAHENWFHGNFVPQVPRQLMYRFTKKYDVVLDPFLGGGTTLIECKRLGRHGIGIELNEETAKKSIEYIEKEDNPYNVKTKVVIGDSSKVDIGEVLDDIGFSSVQLIIYHPPYWNSIIFSDNPNDLSNAKTHDEFIKMFEKVFDNTIKYLDEGRFFGVVIGDYYRKGRYIPASHHIFKLIEDKGHTPKAIIVKNMGTTRKQLKSRNIWRYRALKNNFYEYSHEYILIFQKE